MASNVSVPFTIWGDTSGTVRRSLSINESLLIQNKHLGVIKGYRTRDRDARGEKDIRASFFERVWGVRNGTMHLHNRRGSPKRRVRLCAWSHGMALEPRPDRGVFQAGDHV